MQPQPVQKSVDLMKCLQPDLKLKSVTATIGQKFLLPPSRIGLAIFGSGSVSHIIINILHHATQCPFQLRPFAHLKIFLARPLLARKHALFGHAKREYVQLAIVHALVQRAQSPLKFLDRAL